jgi:hypothetical protein
MTTKKTSVSIPIDLLASFKEEAARLYRTGRTIDFNKVNNSAINEFALRHFFTLPPDERDKAFVGLYEPEAAAGAGAHESA